MLPYRDPSLDPERRADDLVARMTPGELVAQLSGRIFGYGNRPGTIHPDGSATLDATLDAGLADGIGVISYVNMGLPPDEGQAWANALQRRLMATRLGIPALFAEEMAFGHIALGATGMPAPIGLGASFDPALVERAFAAVAAEAGARGCSLAHTPIADLCRDPRWGRVNECFGEDPFHAARCVAAAVAGIQGGNGPRPGGVAATIKHFAGFGLSVGGRQMGPVDCGRRTMFMEVLPPYRAGIEAGASAVMPAYNDIDGLPCHANRWLLTEVLRGRWGFTGPITADYGGINMLVDVSGMASDHAGAARIALAAGVDMDLPLGGSFPALLPHLDEPALRAQVTAAVRRVLILKFRLGLFDQPYRERAALERVGDAAVTRVAEEAAIGSCVLLSNRDLLPLGGVQRMAVVGPHAIMHHLGKDRPHRSRILDGVRAAAPAGCEVVAARGCRITTRDDEDVTYLAETAQTTLTELQARDRDRTLARLRTDVRDLEMPPGSEDADIAAAAELARGCGVAVVCIGESAGMIGENYSENRRCDRDTVHLLGNQLALLRAVKATGVPTVAVVVSGRALAIHEVVALADAVLWVFEGGQARGLAVGRILFGLSEPGGRLPVTLPIAPGAVPCHVGQRRGGSMRPYACAPGDALHAFPFGFGLTWTSFAIDGVAVRSADDGGLIASGMIANTGGRAGTAVVQAYVRDEVASMVRSASNLGGWARVLLAPGERREVTIPIPRRVLVVCDEHGDERLEPGFFAIGLGLDSEQLTWARIAVGEAGSTTR